MTDFTVELIYSLESHTLKNLEDNLKLKSLANYDKLKELIENESTIINSSKDSVFTIAFYTQGQSNFEFDLTVTSLKILKKRNGEKYQRGKYYFVILSKINFNISDNSFEYLKSQIFTEEKEIQKWWLSQFRKYNEKTKLIYDKYDYMPPPPDPPPENLM